MLAAAAERRDEGARLFVENASDLVDALRHGAVELIRFVDDVARDLRAHADQFPLGIGGAAADCIVGRLRGFGEKLRGGGCAFDDRIAQRAGAAIKRNGRFRGAAIECFGRRRARGRALAERFGSIGRQLGQCALGARRIGLDRFRKLLKARVHQIGRGAAACLHLLNDGFRAADKKLFQLTDTAVQRARDFNRAFAEHLIDIGNPLAERVGKLGGATIDLVSDVGDALVERGNDLFAAFGKRFGDLADPRRERARKRLRTAVECFLETRKALIEVAGDFVCL
ncbi:MAG TPA: hypothetical protein VFF63_04345 [Candidatus Babeliales bacterium]|nr:hypothetical protein [Candidatus Babeliales bacterium]